MKKLVLCVVFAVLALGVAFGAFAAGEPDALGEDMVPSPDALAERSALCEPKSRSDADRPATGPFSTSAPAPLRDFPT